MNTLLQSNECLFYRAATKEHSSPEGDHLVSTGLYTSVVPQTASQRYIWLYRQVSYVLVGTVEQMVIL